MYDQLENWKTKGTIWENQLNQRNETNQLNPSNETKQPTNQSTNQPNHLPTNPPTYIPTYQRANQPTKLPTFPPTYLPTYQTTNLPTYQLTNHPTHLPDYPPTQLPSYPPTHLPTTHLPTYLPTCLPTTHQQLTHNITYSNVFFSVWAWAHVPLVCPWALYMEVLRPYYSLVRHYCSRVRLYYSLDYGVQYSETGERFCNQRDMLSDISIWRVLSLYEQIVTNPKTWGSTDSNQREYWPH